MHAEGFTLFPLQTINADTQTPAFDCSNIEAFVLRMNVTVLGTSQGVRPRLELRWPDGTWRVFMQATTQQTTPADYIYQVGRFVAAPSLFTEGSAFLGGLPKVCRITLDVVNTADCTVQVDIVPISAA